ncbi:PEGA domain-containing protein [Patescibacteria group bacterium]
MKRGWLIVIILASILVLVGLVVKTKFFSQDGPGALQISSNSKAIVFIDGNQQDQTPYFSDDLSAGEHTVKIVPESVEDNLIPWEGKVNIFPNILTVINRELAESEASASGEVLSLEKITSRDTSSLAVVSVPDQAVVRINGEPKGFAPVLVEGLKAGDFQVVISSPGYKERKVEASTVVGYKLTISVKLAQEVEGIEETKENDEEVASEEKEEEEEKSDENSEETEEEADSTPTPGATKGPVPTPPEKPYIEVQETPTGWLRVRSEASTASEELTRIEPGSMFPYLEEEKNGWYKIEYEDDEEGWVSNVYAKLIE